MGTVIVLALFAAIDPVRLGIAALLFSRPRPMLNLLVYWLGAMATGITAVVGLLLVMDGFAPTLMPTVSGALASSTARHAQVAIGLFALPVAALIGMGFSAGRARVLMADGDHSAQVLPQHKPIAFARLLDRARKLLEGGSLWVPFVAGLGNGPSVEGYPLILAVIVASGSSIGTRVSATIIFMVGMLAVVEIPLVSSLVSPARTQAVMAQLHNWVRTRRRRIVAVMLAVVGVMLVASGMGST